MTLELATSTPDMKQVSPLKLGQGLDKFMSMMHDSKQQARPVTNEMPLHVHGEDPKPTGSPTSLGCIDNSILAHP